MISSAQDDITKFGNLLEKKSYQEIYDYLINIKDDHIDLNSLLKVQNSFGQSSLMLLLEMNNKDQFLNIWQYIDSCRSIAQILTQLDNDGKSILHYGLECGLLVVHKLLQSIKNHIGATNVKPLYIGSEIKKQNLFMSIINTYSNWSDSHNSDLQSLKEYLDIFQKIAQCYIDFFGDAEFISLIITFDFSDNNCFTLAIKHELYEILNILLCIVDNIEKDEIKNNAILDIFTQRNNHGYSTLALSILNHYNMQGEKSLALCKKIISLMEKKSLVEKTNISIKSNNINISDNESNSNSLIDDIIISDTLDAPTNEFFLEKICRCFDNEGNNVLMMSIILQINDVFKIFISFFSYVSIDFIKICMNIQNRIGDTLLKISIRSGNIIAFEAIVDLLSKKFDSDGIASIFSIEDLDIATLSNNDKMTKLVMALLKSSNLYQEAYRVGKIKQFLHSRNENGETVLLRAVKNEDKEACAFVMTIANDSEKIQKILLLCAIDKYGHTPVTASYYNQDIRVILENFADNNQISFYVEYQKEKLKKHEKYYEFFRKIRGY